MYYQSANKDFTLLHGNCMQLIAELPDRSIDTIFADPPYFLSNGGISCQSGKQVCVNKGDWDKGGTPEYIYEFNKRWISLCQSKLKDDGTIWISGTHHNIHVVMRCLQELGYKVLNTITWQKTDPPPNLSCRYFNFSTELVIWARKSEKKPHKFNYEVMKQLNGGTQMTDVWRIPAVGRWEKTCGKHPTQKTLRLLYRIILASTNEGDTVLDPFSGSATTGIAANLLGRKYIGIEQDLNFLDLSRCRREELNDPDFAEKLKKQMQKNPQEETVLVNHARSTEVDLVIKYGYCYTRAGDTKGSLLVKPGFENLSYVCIHTNGENPRLFRVKKKGSFRVWQPANLQKYGFSVENAPYYAVIEFDPEKEIHFDKAPKLKKGRQTTVADLYPISEFITIN